MFVRIGNLSFPSGTVEWATSQRTAFDAKGLPAQYVLRVDLKGDLQGTDTANVFAQCALLRQACNQQFKDVLLLTDAGAVLEGLRNATALSGVRIQGPDFPDGTKAQGTTYRTFTLSAEATYPGIGGSLQITEASQRVTKAGGGPTYSFLVGKQGPAYRVRDAQQTPYLATQQGTLISLIPNPKPRPPLWPDALLRPPGEVTFEDPRFDGVRWVYAVSWNYAFGSTTPL